jgi:glucosamine-6-phosphate deaminase
MTEVAIVSSPAQGAVIAADLVDAALRVRTGATLGIATGSTPLGVWAELLSRGTDVRSTRAFALDEYVGLPPGHPQSYRSVLEREYATPLGVDPALIRVPGDDGPLASAGARFEQAVSSAGGIDLQLLGIGRTGHIGFNEPGSSLASRTRVKALTRQTRIDNARFFPSPGDVPTHCLTQGLGTILEARTLVLLAFGSAKRDAVAAAVEGPVTSSCPGSVIQLHPRVVVIADEEAAGGLANHEYYRFAWRHRGLEGL